MKNNETTWGNSNMKGRRFPLNLQLFAEDDPEPKTYTQDEVDALLQSNGDTRVSEALKTAKAKWEKDKQKELEKAKSEATELAKLTEEERLQKEFQEEREKFENDKKKFESERLEMLATKELAKAGLNPEFAKFLVADNEENSSANITAFKEMWGKSLESAVKEQLKGDTPPAIDESKTKENPFSKKHFNLTEQAKLFSENPELYKQLKAEAKQE